MSGGRGGYARFLWGWHPQARSTCESICFSAWLRLSALPAPCEVEPKASSIARCVPAAGVGQADNWVVQGGD